MQAAAVSGSARGANAEPPRTADQAAVVAALRDPATFGPSCSSVDVIETHISYVFLAGDHAYKIKKAVRLPFLDFSTLAARRRFCDIELALNRRTAPSLYLDVVPIVARDGGIALGGPGSVLEWAIRMRRFAQEALLSRMAEAGTLQPRHVDALAERVAAFHGSIAGGEPVEAWGSPEHALRLALANLAELEGLATEPVERARVAALRYWTLEEHAARSPLMRERMTRGFVRECHGDLHLRNIAMIEGEPTPFDCIEFEPSMRWSDVMSDVAFASMDFRARGRPDLARRFVNGYLELTGDYPGAPLLPFFQVYRALVRAKVAMLRAVGTRSDAGAAAAARGEATRYLDLAAELSRPQPRAIVVMHGFSGCGKTSLSQALIEATDIVRIRTDVERKRQHGLDALARTDGAVDEGLYAPQASRAAYARIAAIAESIASAGQSVVVDGAFLKRWQRDLFRDAAARCEAAFRIVDLPADDAELERRVAKRAAEARDASDADVAVLRHQLATAEPLASDELARVVTFDANLATEDTIASLSWRDWIASLGSTTRQPAAPPGTSGTPMRSPPGIADKVAFLSQPASYRDATSCVDVVETHLSWVFLTKAHAFKLKKPIRLDGLDYGTLGARQRNAQEEIRLNRRLSTNVYLGVVPLVQAGDGALALEGDGTVVDWLVKMRRLPADRMLDAVIESGGPTRASIVALVAILVRLYRDSVVGPMSGSEYRRRLQQAIGMAHEALVRPHYGLPLREVERIADGQARWLDREAALLDARAAHGHIVEAHGDLRPEHVCLEDAPQIIDCLEFSRELRVQDGVDEIAFLALECERLDAPALRDAIFAAHGELTGSAVPEALVDFYQSYRALVRARLAARHLDDPAVRDAAKWRAQTLDYLRLAREHIARCD